MQDYKVLCDENKRFCEYRSSKKNIKRKYSVKSVIIWCLVKKKSCVLQEIIPYRTPLWPLSRHLILALVCAASSPVESLGELSVTDGLEWSMSGLCLFNLTERLSGIVASVRSALCVSERSRVITWREQSFQFTSRGESALRGKHAASRHMSRSEVLPRNEGRGRDR